MSSTFKISAQLRDKIGKGASRRLRHADQVPGILYGGAAAPMPLTLSHKALVSLLKDKATHSHVLSLEVEGTVHTVLLKDYQRHPFKPRVMHVDFQHVVASEVVHRVVPLQFLNEERAPGVKDRGIVVHHLREVEVKCQVQHLPEHIDVDLVGLALNGVIHLTDLILPKGVELVALTQGEDHDLSVVSIHLPRAEAVVEASAVSEEETPPAEDAAAP